MAYSQVNVRHGSCSEGAAVLLWRHGEQMSSVVPVCVGEWRAVWVHRGDKHFILWGVPGDPMQVSLFRGVQIETGFHAFQTGLELAVLTLLPLNVG